MKLFLLVVLILMALYFLFAIINYGKARKTGGPQQKFWLIRAVVALVLAIAAGLGLYHLKQKEKNNGTD